MKTKPIFTHDCEKCHFLGHAVVDGTPYDFYACNQGVTHPTMINILARYGNDGPDYASTLAGYVSPLSLTDMIGMALYAKFLGANSASGFWRGRLSKDGVTVLEIKD